MILSLTTSHTVWPLLFWLFLFLKCWLWPCQLMLQPTHHWVPTCGWKHQVWHYVSLWLFIIFLHFQSVFVSDCIGSFLKSATMTYTFFFFGVFHSTSKPHEKSLLIYWNEIAARRNVRQLWNSRFSGQKLPTASCVEMWTQSLNGRGCAWLHLRVAVVSDLCGADHYNHCWVSLSYNEMHGD